MVWFMDPILPKQNEMPDLIPLAFHLFQQMGMPALPLLTAHHCRPPAPAATAVGAILKGSRPGFPARSWTLLQSMCL